jgi:cardiolipin synthase
MQVMNLSTAAAPAPPPMAPVPKTPGVGALVLSPTTPRPGVLPADDAGSAITGDAWKLYDETNAAPAIVDAVNGARQVVNAEFFGFSDAGKGATLVTALADAARRGVEVNVVTDFISVGAFPVGSYQRMRSKIEDAGGTVKLTSRIPFSPRAKETPGLKHVDHRKVVTVDGTTGFVGGMNLVKLTDSYHDSMVGLTGVSAARLAADQLDRWERVGGNVTERHRRTVTDALGDAPIVPTDPNELAIVANAPEQQRFELTDGYRDLIRNAKQRLWIASPGISDRDIVGDLADAARRGVDVRIISSAVAPVAPPVGWVARAHMANIIGAGGTAFEIPDTLHRKALVADDEAILSSYNLTKRSADADHEVGVRTSDPEFVQAVSDLLQRDIDRSTRFDPATFTGLTAKIGTAFAKHVSY